MNNISPEITPKIEAPTNNRPVERFLNNFASQTKDLIGGLTRKRNLSEGEITVVGYLFDSPTVEIMGFKPNSTEPVEKYSPTQVQLETMPDDGTKVQFYLGEGSHPVFTNTGDTEVKILASQWNNPDDGSLKAGEVALKPGEWVNLFPQGGSNYELHLNGGVIVKFSGIKDYITGQENTNMSYAHTGNQ